MTWFKLKRGKYWYMVRRENGKERYYYLGTEEDIIKKSRPTKKAKKDKEPEITEIKFPSKEPQGQATTAARSVMKECNLGCEFQHEGFCCLEEETGLNPFDCDVTKEEELIKVPEAEL